jgi:hypothetical protein
MSKNQRRMKRERENHWWKYRNEDAQIFLRLARQRKLKPRKVRPDNFHNDIDRQMDYAIANDRS